MFDVTVYTDVRADEALDGVAGFNFMAESAGITAADRKFVAQRMLHVVRSSWHVDHSDELAHPPSCTYRAADGRYFLSRGKSTGQTVTAPRPGNQLTQTIVTSEPEDFIPYRPAQLYAASQWNLSRDVDGKQLASWPTPLEIDAAYEADELKEALVDRSPFGASFLPSFLTMVEQAAADPGKKLIIVHTELDVVMRHIALASLFLDPARALTMSFVAFAEQPLAAVADIVGATPDFGSTPSAETAGAAYNVVDLLAVAMSPVEVSQSAARQAEWFADDPLDALAAIEVARRWEVALGADIATDAAAIVSFTDRAAAVAHDRAAALRAVSGLLAGGLGDDLAMYTDELLDAIVTSPPSCEEDFVLAADAIGASHQAGMDEVGAGILLPTLEALAARPDLIPAWSEAAARWQVGAAPLRWDSDESRVHALGSQAEIVNRAGSEQLVDTLIAGKLTDLLPDGDDIAPALDRLAEYWCGHPELSDRKMELPYQPNLGSRLKSRIISGLEHEDQPVVSAFVAGEWNWLAGPGSVLEPWHSAVTIGSVDPELRADKIASAGTQLPPGSWKLALAGIDLPAGSPVISAWVDSHPDLPAELSAWIVKGLNASQGSLAGGRAARDLISAMLHSRARTTNAGLERLLADIDRLEGVYGEANRAAGEERNPALVDFAAGVSPYVAFFGAEVGNLLVRCTDQRGTQRLERAAGEWATPCIETALGAIARRTGDAEAVTWALSLYESGTDLQAGAATEFLLAMADSRGGRQRLDQAREHIAHSWLPVLDQLMEESKKGRLTRNIKRGGKRLFNKER